MKCSDLKPCVPYSRKKQFERVVLKIWPTKKKQRLYSIILIWTNLIVDGSSITDYIWLTYLSISLTFELNLTIPILFGFSEKNFHSPLIKNVKKKVIFNLFVIASCFSFWLPKRSIHNSLKVDMSFNPYLTYFWLPAYTAVFFYRTGTNKYIIGLIFWLNQNGQKTPCWHYFR